jgi:flavin-dependent dehydrogenase
MVAERDADVIVVGAGPAGSTAAYYLAQSGLDVLLLEKTSFPREKVCGDGLTPRAVHSLIGMGIPTDEKDGWIRNKGLRVLGGGLRLELPWPELASWPDYGLVRPRLDFDETLVRHARKAGARLREQVTVTGPVLDRTGRVVGVQARTPDGPATFSAPLVGQRVGGIDWPADTSLVAILREGRVLVPQPDDPMQAGDELFFVTSEDVEDELGTLLRSSD